MKVVEGRGVSCGSLRPFARDQVQAGCSLTLTDISDEMGATVELIDDVEYRIFQPLLRGALRENSADAQMGLSAQLLRNQNVRCFLDPVVEEGIRPL